MAVTAASEWMVVGTIVGAFGIRGEIKVELNTDYPDRFNALDTVYVGADHVPRTVTGVRKHKDRILLKLEGVDSPERVDALRGTELSVPRKEAVPLPDGHYFLDDIIGIAVCTTDGRHLGSVTEVIRTGSNDVFVVSGGQDAILVPVIHDAVQELDLASRRAVVEPWVLVVDE